MKVWEHPKYVEDLTRLSGLALPWDNLEGKRLLISGATGMIGSCLIDFLMFKNRRDKLGCTVYALGRSEEKARRRFSYCWDSPYFRFLEADITRPLECGAIGQLDYVIHLASNTHPVAYATDPIGTIAANILGTQNLLEFASSHNAVRCAFASSNEIYGENRGDTEKFDESYCGYIDANTLRAGYPESKRCGEALCQAYISQKGMDIVIPRFTRCYGPTLLPSDTKALSQFIHRSLEGRDIILKSEGTQFYSYIYEADAVSGLLTVLLKGSCGEAYNIADEASDIHLKDLASLIADSVGRKVVFELPDSLEKAGYSTATKARLSSEKLRALGWHALYTIEEGIARTMEILSCPE